MFEIRPEKSNASFDRRAQSMQNRHHSWILTTYTRSSLALIALAGTLLCGVGSAQSPTGELHISRNAAHEVIATITGEVGRCGVTALSDPPTIRRSGTIIEITQPVAGIACRADVPQGALRPYQATVNLGSLPPGKYTVNWNFPKLTTTYEVSP